MERIASTKHTVILLLIIFGVSFATWIANTRHGGAAQGSHLAIYVSAIVAELALLRYVAIGSRVPLRELAGNFRWFDPLIAVAIFAATRVISYSAGAVDDRTTKLLPQSLTDALLWVAVAIAAGVSEELVFRGYLQRQLPLGVITQALVFGFAHGYQGFTSMVKIVLIGLVFGVAAKFRRGLGPGMIAHAATDLTPLLALLR